MSCLSFSFEAKVEVVVYLAENLNNKTNKILNITLQGIPSGFDIMSRPKINQSLDKNCWHFLSEAVEAKWGQKSLKWLIRHICTCTTYSGTHWTLTLCQNQRVKPDGIPCIDMSFFRYKTILNLSKLSCTGPKGAISYYVKLFLNRFKLITYVGPSKNWTSTKQFGPV